MKVCIITEGTAKTGYGHLTRCLAISQGFIEHNISPKFIVNCDKKGESILKDCHLIVLDWVKNSDVLIEHLRDADIVIIDSYEAGKDTYYKINEVVKKSVYLDDMARFDYPPGMIINAALDAHQLPYKFNENHNFLLGPAYTPLRRAFWEIPKRRATKKVKDVLVVFGGNDLKGVTFSILNAISEQFPECKFHVILGFRGYKEEIDQVNSKNNIKYYYDADDSAMVELMLTCDVAISAAGQTLNELARTGVQTIALCVADNQLNNIQSWFHNGFLEKIIILKDPNWMDQIISELDRIVMAPKSSSNTSIDGDGAYRIASNCISSLHNISLAKDIHATSFINLQKNALMEILAWRNNPNTRSFSLNKSEITQDEHMKFVKSLFTSLEKYYWVISKNERRLGVIELHDINFEKSEAFWGYYLNPKYLGSGKGFELQFYALKIAFQYFNLKQLFAIVSRENSESMKMQSLYGFTIFSENDGQRKLVLTKERYLNIPSEFKIFAKEIFDDKEVTSSC